MSDAKTLHKMDQETLRSFIQAVNDTTAEYPKDKCIHQLFEQQAQKTPDATAVVFEDQTQTYAQLNERANQLAHTLRAHGVGPDVPVGVCMDRCIELLPVLLGILKAGGAYVPLDPKYPKERLGHMIHEAEIRVILTQQQFQTLDLGQGLHVVAVDSQWEHIRSASPASNPDVSIQPHHAAYILFTSGSTGVPKGVVVEHDAILNSFLWLQETFALGPLDRILQKTTFTFDVSLWDLLWPLTAGARVVLASPGKHIDMDYLVETIQSHQITVINFVPSVLDLFLAHPRVSQCTSLRLVLAAGEALSYPLQTRFFELLKAALHNLYGPTEAAIQVTWWPCRKDSPYPFIPIGKPIANTQAYILDNSLQPVPVGVPGELYIGGVQLARGYLARPDLTAERFIPDPFSSQSGARLYKTGDVCRWMEDGNIEYLGRADDQVKIRGFRIELGEIENALRSHPGVVQAAVKVQETQPGQKMLAGYYVCKQSPGVSVDNILAYLRQRLPDYMVPAGVMELDQIPLTASGKTNRKALPAFEALHSSNSSLPQTPTEQTLAQIWKALLGIKDVYREDNFFHLGGHSLKAIQTGYSIQKKLGINLPVSTIFENPTLEQFARAIDRHCTQSEHHSLRLPTVSRSQALPLSFAQKRMWFIQQLSLELPVYNISWMIYIKGCLDIPALEKSLQEIIRRHEAFRTIFPIQNGQPTQFIQSDLSWNLTIENIDSDVQPPLTSFQTIAESRAQRLFNLEQGPLFQFTLLCMESDDYALLLNIHHLITDGWSMGIFTQELTELYQHYTQNTPVNSASLPVQYADYGCWQQAEIETLKKQDFDYWKQKLAGDIPEVTIPLDFPRTTAYTYHGQWETRHIQDSAYTALKDLSHQKNTTLYTILLSAFHILLYYYNRSEDITVGSPISGRTHKEIENIIGFFVNTTVLRCSITKDMSFLDVLHQVGQLCLEAQYHQDMPYDVLVELLNPPRQANRNLYFQTMLAYQDSRYWAVSLPNLKCQTIEISTKTSKIDFTLFCDESHSGLHLRAEYNTTLYQSSTIRTVLQTFEHLLSAIVNHPSISISELLRQINSAHPVAEDSISPQGCQSLSTELPMVGHMDDSERTLQITDKPKILSSSYHTLKNKTLPHCPLQKQLAELWKELLGIKEIYLEDNFFHLGGHSLLATKLFYRLEERFQIDLPLGLIFEAPTLGQLAEHLQKQRHEAVSKTLFQIKSGRLKQSFFYLPGVGGHTLNFYHLAHLLTIPLSQYGLNLPGLNGNPTILRTIEQMAVYFIREIQQVQPEGPYWLCGFSMGGRIAYEMALQLTKQGHSVAFLGILGTSAPGFPKAYLWKPAHYLERFWTFCGLSLDEKIRYIQSQRQYKKLRKQRQAAQKDGWDIHEFPNYRKLHQAGLEAFIRYQTQQRYDGDIVLFREMKDFNPLDKEMYTHPTFGWDPFVTGQIRVHDIDCIHPNILNQPHVQTCAMLLEKEIQETLHKWKL